VSNPTSNRIYQRVGYEAVCDVTDYVLGDLRTPLEK
jgi:predicted GNAT family acetyltransferase